MPQTLLEVHLLEAEITLIVRWGAQKQHQRGKPARSKYFDQY